VREAARKDKKIRFAALLHHLDVPLLIQSFYSLKSEAAPGSDGVTWQQYEADVYNRIEGLHRRIHAGSYRATPVKRAYIPKADGQMRPLGIAAVEDKIVQHAVVTILNQVYEVDFLGFSYGLRSGRSAHDALDALFVGITGKKVNWVLDADIRGFFDTIDHEWLIKFVEHRIADPRIVRLIQKWLKVGVSEDGRWSETKVGTPQGAVASPLLANVYLHYVFDLWVQQWRKRHAKGDVIVVRYADDFVLGFQHRHEAERFLNDLKDRFKKFGLELHPDKTRLIEFGRFAARDRQQRGDGKPETFDFLGFTHSCGVKRLTRTFLVKRKTSTKRMRARLCVIGDILYRGRHRPFHKQAEWLGRVVAGYFRYFAIPGNVPALEAFRNSGVALLVDGASASKPEASLELGSLRAARFSADSAPTGSPSLSQQALLRQTPEVGAGCDNPARPDLRGGRFARTVPTATPKRNRWLKRALVQAAWSACLTKGTYLAVFLPAAGGPAVPEAAAVRFGPHDAGGHVPLPARRADYNELGGDYFERRDRDRITHRLVGRLEGLGLKVTLEPLPQAA
jgi:group II intron reverse transcriptase/maturase